MSNKTRITSFNETQISDKLMELLEENHHLVTIDDMVQQYEEVIDQDGLVGVCGIDFYRSTILKELDPIAYENGLCDYIDSLEYRYVVDTPLHEYLEVDTDAILTDLGDDQIEDIINEVHELLTEEEELKNDNG